MLPVVTIRYVWCSFIMLPIKAVRACNPFLCSEGASDWLARALNRPQPRPPCKQQRWPSVNVFLWMVLLPPGCNCVPGCVFWAEVTTSAAGNTQMCADVLFSYLEPIMWTHLCCSSAAQLYWPGPGARVCCAHFHTGSQEFAHLISEMLPK